MTSKALKEIVKMPLALLKKIDEANTRLNEENKLIGELIKELNSIKREHRATGLLSEIYLNLLCSMILASRYRGKISDYDVRTLSTNRRKLLKLKLISQDINDEIQKIQEIRNIYAHSRHVKVKPVTDEIFDLVKETTTYKHLISYWKRNKRAKTEHSAYLEVVNNLIKKLRVIHRNLWTDFLKGLDDKIIQAKAKQRGLKTKSKKK